MNVGKDAYFNVVNSPKLESNEHMPPSKTLNLEDISQRWRIPLVCCFLLCMSQHMLLAQPTLANASFFGGPGDQSGRSITIANGTIYVGTDSGQLVRYPVPLGSATASPAVNGTAILGIAASGSVVYAVGYAVPPACGSTDTVGSVEGKSLLSRYDATSGTLLGCQSTHFFPYTGSEGYGAAVNGAPFIYATGAGETCGFGNNTFLLSKFDLSGALLSTVGEPGLNFSAPTCSGGSSAAGLSLFNGNLYVAGYSKLTSEDGVNRPVLMKYALDFTRQWKQRPTDNQGGVFNAVTGFGGALYAVGYVTVSGRSRFLIEKYDEAGNRLWSKISGGPGDDAFNGAIGIGSRLFAVGSTSSQGAGGTDAAILEIDPATGSTISTTLYGGVQDEVAYAAATDGTDLYVVGASKSFASSAGNQIGQNDAVVLRYVLTPLTITTSSLPSGVLGTGYSQTLSAAGGVPPYSNWTVSAGALPAGLTLNNSSGVINGTPTSAAGSPFAFSVTVMDSIGNTSLPKALSITIGSPPVITTTSLPNGTVGTFYSQSLAASGGTQPYGNWAVSLGALPPGLTLSASAGTISGSPSSAVGGPFGFSITVRDNAGITSAPKALSIAVSSPTCTYGLSSPGSSFSSSASNGSVGVITSFGTCAWIASSPVNWVVITGGAGGTGNGTVTYSVLANLNSASRSTTLTIAGQSYTVTQAGQGCLLGLTPLSVSLGVAGGAGSLSVGLSGSDCVWTASSSASFVTITAGSSGTGSGSVNYSVAGNQTSSVSRSATITVLTAGTQSTFIITEAGATCTFSLPQASQSFPSGGGIGTASVVAPGGCFWTASSGVPYVTITSGASGSGNGTVGYTVAPNPASTSRTGTLTIANQAYTVTEAATTSTAGCTASVPAVAQVALEGRTEVLGDLVLSCTGLSATLNTTISLALNTNVSNVLTSANITDAVLTVNGITPQSGQIAGYNIVQWPGVLLIPGSGGAATVRISGVRADASLLGATANLQPVSITGLVSVASLPAVPVSGGQQTLGNASPSLVFLKQSASPPTGGAQTLIPVVYQETSAAAFHTASGGTPATRLRMVLSNVPTGVQVYAPVFPNEGSTQAQLYSANGNGVGGSPVAGSIVAGAFYQPLTVSGGVATATWVVLSANPSQIEGLTFPLLVTNALLSDLNAIQVAGSLAPVSIVSAAAVLSEAAPVPRYRDFSVPQKLVNLRMSTSLQVQPAALSQVRLSGGHFAANGAVQVGSNVTFTNQLVNDTSDTTQTATNVKVRDNLPSGLSLVSCVATDGATCNVTAGNQVEVNYGTVSAGQFETVTVVARVNPTVADGTVLENPVSAAGDQVNADLSASSASSSFIVTNGTPANGQPAHITALGGTSQSAAISTTFASALQATVTDSAGNPVSGAIVTFTVPSTGASAVLSSGTAVSNISGVAGVIAAANNFVGSYLVTASVGALSTSFSLTNISGTSGSGGRVATQSSRLAGYASAGAASAIDGNTDGNFFNGSVTHTNADNNAWWQEDLGASTAIGTIVIWNRTDCCGSRLSDYWVFASDTPFQSTDTPVTLQGRAGTWSSHQTTTPNPSTAISAGVQGRYVRVQLSGTGNLSLAEVQVLGSGIKVATQSSTLAGYASAGAVAAIDGNTDGNFFNGSVTHTNADNNAWWQEDLGTSTAIGTIVIWNRTDCCSARLSDYWVFASDTPFQSTDTPATLQGRVGVWSSHQTTTPNPSTAISAGVQGRYIRVQLTGSGNLSLAEVQVLGSGIKVAAQSSTLPGYASSGAASAIDGNTDGSFFNGSVTHTNADSNAWWQEDLGASTAIGSIVIWNRTDCCSSRLSDYWVFASDTPFLSTDTPATLQNRPGVWSSHQTTAPNPSTVITAGVQGRYIRVQLSGTGNLSLAEVQVLGSGAGNKVATQSSTLPGYASAGAGSAIDGNTDGNFFDGSVTHTNLENNPWWQEDLGGSTGIASVVIWNRTDCCSSRLSDYWVFVSDTPFQATDTLATLQSRAGIWSSHQTTAPDPSTTIAVGVQGRYVRVQLSGADNLSLAEVQVIGR
jgi:uncharacterized repeat protein (TIGR01451 family)